MTMQDDGCCNVFDMTPEELTPIKFLDPQQLKAKAKKRKIEEIEEEFPEEADVSMVGNPVNTNTKQVVFQAPKPVTSKTFFKSSLTPGGPPHGMQMPSVNTSNPQQQPVNPNHSFGMDGLNFNEEY